jgi:CheY-like chemotaxis protein
MTASPILVVDDDPKIVTLVRTYLERDGLLGCYGQPGGHRRLGVERRPSHFPATRINDRPAAASSQAPWANVPTYL